MQALTQFVGGLVGTQAQPGLSPVDLAFAARTDWTEQDREYLHHQRYYQGHHRDPRPLLTDPLSLSTRLGAGDYNWQPRHNVMGKVIDTVVARLSVYGFTPDFGGRTDEEKARQEPLRKLLTAALSTWWRAARMDETQNTLHAQTLVMGDGYLITRIDDAGRPSWSYRDALHMLPLYDPADLTSMLACYEIWSDWPIENGLSRERRHLTIYRPDEISKWWAWVGDPRWRLWTEDGDGGVIDWRDDQGRPLGIPVHHFRNKPRGAAFGRSDLADLIPLQDELNLRAWNTGKAAAYAGGPQRAIIDAAIALDASGEPSVEYRSGPDQVWLIQSQAQTRQAQAVSLAAGNALELQDVTDRELKTIAALADVPLHLIWPEGALPSGESLKTAEASLVAKCRDRSITFGDAWEDAQKMGVRLANRFGGAGLPDPETFTLTAQWAPFETRSALSDAQVATLARPIVGDRESLRIMGYTDEEADKIEAEKAAQPQPTAQQAGQLADGVAGT